MSSAVAALVPVLGCIVAPLVAIAIASDRVEPVMVVPGALVISVALLSYGSSRILDATEEIPAALDLIADMVPMSGARAVNLGLAEVALAAMVWVPTLLSGPDAYL